MKINQNKVNSFEVSLLDSCMIAIVLVLVGYIIFLPFMQHTLVGRVVIKSGGIGQLIGFLGSWSLVIICFKFNNLMDKYKNLEEDLLPSCIDSEITPDNARKFIRYLQSRFHGTSIQFVSKRLESALEKVIYAQPSSEIFEDLYMQFQIDTDELESSYTMIRTFIWAIPILGFIGTVLGIGQAIGGFAESLQSAENIVTIKSSLGHVVNGLAFAFDTTFLGLLVSMFVMFPMSMIHKSELSLLNLINETYGQDLRRRIKRRSPAA